MYVTMHAYLCPYTVHTKTRSGLQPNSVKKITVTIRI